MSIEGIGYEGQTLEALISELRIRGVTVLADVRLNAISRKRGFSKRALATAVSEAGIRYLHLPALGNQRDNRTGYAELATPLANEVRARFREALESEAAGRALSELAELARVHAVAVLCYEADETRCHRQQVLEKVQAALRRDLVTS